MSSGTHVFRFSLTTLFGMVLFAAFGTAAIRFASPLWAGLTMAVTVPLLFAAILGALFRLGQARAFWTGMAVCGWGYLVVVMAPWLETGLGQHLPTSYLLNHIHGQIQKQLHGAGPSTELVLRTGHALFALLFGFIGGVTAKWLYLTRPPREERRQD
ncbi:MAG TPA: hypothetical protein VND64_34470 [Pirellulales bacterium]|nr:hypothetical protein [Pirellulales bacterium]